MIGLLKELGRVNKNQDDRETIKEAVDFNKQKGYERAELIDQTMLCLFMRADLWHLNSNDVEALIKDVINNG